MKVNNMLIILPQKLIDTYLWYKDNSENISLTATSKKFKVNRGNLIKMDRLGYVQLVNGEYCLTNDSYYMWKEIFETLKDKYISLKYIIKKYKIGNGTTQKYSKYFCKDDVNFKERSFKVEFDRLCFNKESPEKWYWIGFLLADGNIFRSELRLKIGEIDIDHLKKYCDFLNLSYDKITIVTNEHSSYTKKKSVTSCKVVISDYKIVEYLKSLNFTYNKSGKEIPPDNIPDIYLRDFLRGFFDGDGSINSKNMAKLNFVGSLDMLNWINNTLNNVLNIPKATITPKGKIYSITWYRLETKLKILDYFYKDSEVYLERKFSLYKEMSRL